MIPRILSGTISEAEIMSMVQGGSGMRGLSIMMLYGMVMLGLLIAGIVLLIVKRRNWEFLSGSRRVAYRFESAHDLRQSRLWSSIYC